MVHKKVVTVKRLADGKLIRVAANHFAVNDPRFEVQKPKRKPKAKDLE